MHELSVAGADEVGGGKQEKKGNVRIFFLSFFLSR